MIRITFALLAVALLTAGGIGCRAEVDTDTASHIGVAR
jgi:hypothetical protein